MNAAEISNDLVYATLAVWTLCLVMCAAEIAFGTRSRVARATGGVADASAASEQAGADTAGVASVSVLTRDDVPEDDVAASRSTKLAGIAHSLFVLGTLLLVGAVIARGVAAERAPWGNMYEFALAGSMFTAIAFLGFSKRYDLRALTVWVVTVLLLTLGLAVAVLYVPAGPLVPALRSIWLVIHVLAAIVAAAVFTVGMVASALQIVAERAEKTGKFGRISSRLPASSVLDRTAYRFVAFGFPIWTFAVVAGAIWAEASWGRFWAWDPKEVWALITWLVYAAYLHARATAGWKGQRASVVAILAYMTLLFDFFGVNLWFVGLHSYGGV